MDLVLYHHNHTKSNYPDLCSILKKADHHSASEREDIDDTQEVNKTPLISLFSKIVLEGNDKVDEQYIPLNKLSLDDGSFNNLKPAAKKDTMGGWNLVPEYNRLWDEFNFEFELIQNKTDFNTLLALLKKYASTMPSAAYKSKSDISLYDHSKTTAALAVSRYLFNRDGDVKLTQKDDLNCYLAIEGDISGIQKFIFKISSPQEAQSGMSKRLRGRSLYLTLLCDAIATHIAEELELCEANILFCGGGRFTIIGPNTKTAKEKLAEIKSKLNKFFIDEFNAELYLALVSIECCGDDLAKFGQITRKLSNKLNEDDEKEKSLELLKNAPDNENMELKEITAIVYMDLNYYNEALELFNEILDSDYNRNILDLKVDCLFFLGKFEAVVKTADEYLEVFGNNLDVLTNKKAALKKLNRKNEAEEVNNIISNLNAVNKFAVYMPKDQTDEVIPDEIYESELEQCFNDLKYNPDDSTVLIAIATFLYNLDRRDESIEYLDKISDDADSVTINAKACMFMKLEKFPKALETLNKSLKKDKTNIITLISKSECLMELKKYEEVLVCADEGLEIDKTNIPLWKNKFCALIELDRLIEAKEVQDLIFDLEITNDKAEGSLKKAINRFYSMEYRECLNLCYDVLDADKDNEEAAILMMNAVYLLGDLTEAPKALYRALNCNNGEILTRN